MTVRRSIITLFEAEKKLEELLPESRISWEASKFCSKNFNPTWIHIDDEGVAYFNKIYALVKDWKDAKLTSHGYISRSREFRFYTKAIIKTRTSLELLIVAPKYCHRIIVRSDYGKEKEGKMAGKAAFSQFAKRCSKEGLDLRDISIENGKEVKETIPSPDIRMIPAYAHKTVERAFHVDINSAYMAGIKEQYGHLGEGALGRVIDDIYEHRKDGTQTAKYNKAILNCTQGYMQSRWCVLNGHGYALAHLSKAGIEFCYNKLQKVIRIFESRGCKLVATNTDGAWFEDLELPRKHRREELEVGTGTCLGGVKIDHYNCTLRYKSAGAYEYIEDGVYTPVIRGKTALERIKPKSEWVWGDIYNKEAREIKYIFIIGRGLIDEEEIRNSI